MSLLTGVPGRNGHGYPPGPGPWRPGQWHPDRVPDRYLPGYHRYSYPVIYTQPQYFPVAYPQQQIIYGQHQQVIYTQPPQTTTVVTQTTAPCIDRCQTGYAHLSGLGRGAVLSVTYIDSQTGQTVPYTDDMYARDCAAARSAAGDFATNLYTNVHTGKTFRFSSAPNVGIQPDTTWYNVISSYYKSNPIC
jgi:hypothetical protein